MRDIPIPFQRIRPLEVGTIAETGLESTPTPSSLCIPLHGFRRSRCSAIYWLWRHFNWRCSQEMAFSAGEVVPGVRRPSVDGSGGPRWPGTRHPPIVAMMDG
jgi:hypothetical protein